MDTTLFLKKGCRIIVLLLTLSVSIVSKAQIQRNFFELVLGQSTKADAVSKLKSQRYEVRNIADGNIMITSVDFGGRAWSGVGFFFYKGKLSEVKFIKMPKPANLKYYYEYLVDDLKIKYKSNYIAELSSNREAFFMDSNTALSVVYSDNPESVTLLYQDNQDVKDYIQQECEEL